MPMPLQSEADQFKKD